MGKKTEFLRKMARNVHPPPKNPYREKMPIFDRRCPSLTEDAHLLSVFLLFLSKETASGVCPPGGPTIWWTKLELKYILMALFLHYLLHLRLRTKENPLNLLMHLMRNFY